MQPLIIPNRGRGAPDFLLDREWLCTNGLGGYASGTLAGVNTRRDHGIFVPQAGAPWGRVVMLANLIEKVNPGQGKEVSLSGFEFKSGAVTSEADKVLKEFRLEYLVPVWTFECAGSVIEKKVFMQRHRNLVWIQYAVVSGPPINLSLTPYITFRTHDKPFIHLDNVETSLSALENGLRVHLSKFDYPLELRISGPKAVFTQAEHWIKDVFFRVEHERGEHDTDIILTPGYFSFPLGAREKAVIALGVNCPLKDVNTFETVLLEEHKKRLETGILINDAREPLIEHLSLAADQFLINKSHGLHLEPQDVHRCSIIAGYHWFLDWGRDSMISLEGLTLCTGRFALAKEILLTLSGYIKDGLLFNNFEEGQTIPSNSSADATLWFFHALNRYYKYTGDKELLERLFPLMSSFINAYLGGCAPNIRTDAADGLVVALSQTYPLTWMDAQMAGRIFTPRSGKPVEIEALWFNALKLMSTWAEELGLPDNQWSELARHVYRSFNAKFWDEQLGYLFDVIDGDGARDASLRPNQIFSISLDHPVLEPSRWFSVVKAVQNNLITEYGLRSLARSSSAYHGIYMGNRFDRDSAYHQGAVWTWLMGPFIDAWLKVHGNKEKARQFLSHLSDHLKDAGVGSLSEIFDGDPPFHPRGCIAQAWSVAEILRVSLLLR